MKTFILLSISLTVYSIALGQFDLQYCGTQQHLKSFQEIRSAWHDFVLSCGGYGVRFKAIENKVPSRRFQGCGFYFGWGWNERNLFLWDICVRFHDKYNLNTRGEELELRRGLMLQLWVPFATDSRGMGRLAKAVMLKRPMGWINNSSRSIVCCINTLSHTDVESSDISHQDF